MRLYKRCPCPEDTPCTHALWYSFKHKGKVYRKSTYTANRKLASRAATRERNKVVGERAGLEMEDQEEQVQPLFSAARTQYIEWVKGDHPATEDDDRRTLTVFQVVLGDRRLDDYAPFDIVRWRSARLAEGVVRNTVIRNEITIRGFFSKAKLWHGLKLSPFDRKDPKGERLKAWKPDETTRLPLDDAQLHIVFTQMPPFYALICQVTHETDARLAEVLNLKRTDIGISSLQFIRKGGKLSTVTITDDLRTKLLAFCPLNQTYVFPWPGHAEKPMPSNLASAYMTLEFRKIGLAGFSHHCIRHTGITEMLENGVNPRTIQQYAGWTSLRQLNRYGHARDAEARRAVEGQAAKYKRVMAMTPEPPAPEAEVETGAQ